MTLPAEDTIGHDPAPVNPGARTVPGVPGLMERLEDAESLDATAEALWEVLPDWVVTGWGRQLLVASLPTAAAGLSDWSRREKRDRRVGVVHAHDARRDTGQPAARCAGEPFLITTTP